MQKLKPLVASIEVGGLFRDLRFERPVEALELLHHEVEPAAQAADFVFFEPLKPHGKVPATHAVDGVFEFGERSENPPPQRAQHHVRHDYGAQKRHAQKNLQKAQPARQILFERPNEHVHVVDERDDAPHEEASRAFVFDRLERERLHVLLERFQKIAVALAHGVVRFLRHILDQVGA